MYKQQSNLGWSVHLLFVLTDSLLLCCAISKITLCCIGGESSTHRVTYHVCGPRQSNMYPSKIVSIMASIISAVGSKTMNARHRVRSCDSQWVHPQLVRCLTLVTTMHKRNGTADTKRHTSSRRRWALPRILSTDNCRTVVKGTSANETNDDVQMHGCPHVDLFPSSIFCKYPALSAQFVIIVYL
jgi:hypothetical protein